MKLTYKQTKVCAVAVVKCLCGCMYIVYIFVHFYTDKPYKLEEVGAGLKKQTLWFYWTPLVLS